MDVVGGGFAGAVLVTGVLSFVFAGVAWRKRTDPGGTALVLYNLVIAVALFAYAVDITSTSRSTQLLALSIWLPAQALTATTWAYIAVEYTGLRRWANWKTVAVLWAEPVVFTALVVVPAGRDLLFDLPESGTAGSIFFVGAETKPLLAAHYGFLFLVMLVGTLLFVRLFVRSKHIYRTQATAVAVAAVAPWVVLVVQAAGFAPTEDPSSIAFAVSGIALTVGLYRFKTLDPVPAARETIVEQMGDGVIVLDEDGVVSSLNPAARRLLVPDESTERVVGTRIDELFPGWSQLPDTHAGATAWQELSLSVDGTDRVVEVQASPFRDRFDQLVGRLVVLRDVTDRKRREQELARYKTIFESVTDRVYVLDAEGRFVLVNEPFAALAGRDPESLAGQPFESILADDSATAVTDTPVESDTVELTIETGDGETIPCEARRAPISFESLDAGSVGILRDISERKQLESSLQRTTERLETIVEASPLAIIATDPEGHVEVWNAAATETFGYEAETVRGDYPPIVSGEQAEQLRQLFERVLEGERITGYEMEMDRADGSVLDARISFAPLMDDAGTIQGTVGVVSDVTDRKERERRLHRQNERLDEFASLLSHDLRNPLEVSSSRLELLETTADLDAEASNHAEQARAALERMEELIEDALTLAREGRDIGETRPLALDSLATRAWQTVSTPDATLDVTAAEGAVVEGDRSRVLELLENLFRNSMDHARPIADQQPADGGRLADGENTHLTIRVETFEGGFAVEDDGQGIPPEEHDQILELGYTTAADGTGLGLAIVTRIAEAHGWDVSVTESDAGGARFEFVTA